MRKMRENPRKNVEKVYAAWQRGVKLDLKSISTDGRTIWSYRTWLVHRESDGDVLFNSTHYSQTTTTQQNGLRQLLREDGVPMRGHSSNVERGSRYPSTSYGATLKGMDENPPLVTFGNPPKGAQCMSKNVVEIRYQHEDDKKYYRHSFRSRQVKLYAKPGSKTVWLVRVDGKPIVSEY